MDVTESAVVAEPLPEAPAQTDDASLADHEAAFGAGGSGAISDDDDAGTADTGETAEAAAERDQKGRFRHRASSQKATPDDVAQINTLTRELRAKEQELIKARPDALAGSPRLVALRRQIKAIEAELGEVSAPKPAPVARAAAPVVERPTTSTFTDAEPTIEDFANEADPYTAWTRALGRYDRRKEQFEAEQQTASQRAETDRKAASDALRAGYHTRLTAFIAQKPDFTEKFTAASQQRDQIPLLLEHTLLADDNGPALLYHLLQHPDFFDEMHLLADGKPVNETNVAILRRRLSQHAQAASTGSAAVTRIPQPAPRPPNPVRTGPIHTGDDLPGDESSLADHEKAFGRSRRR